MIHIEVVNKSFYFKTLDLASDPKKHLNLGLHITQKKNNNKYGLINSSYSFSVIYDVHSAKHIFIALAKAQSLYSIV